MDNKEADPNHPLQHVPRPRLPRILPDPSAFRLPPACVSKGAAREQQREGTAGGSMVLTGGWAQVNCRQRVLRPPDLQ